MSMEETIFLAKKNIVDSIWKSANLEGVNITFPQTYAIYENAKVSNVSAEDVLTVVNLKHAWQYILNNIKEPVSLEMLCKIQEKVAYNQALTTGELRSGRVGIAGTDYVPKIPVEEEVKEQLSELLNNPYPVDRALNVMFWGMKSQLFFDGNKRTSMLAANKIMIENGCGIISIKVDDIAKFNELLSEYYSTDNLGKVKDFVYDKCIQGIEYEKEVDLDL